MTAAPDELVAGKYRLTRLLGRGGMGSVWEGIHLTLGNRVAVKFIDGAVAESPEALQRFENEARAAAKLNSKYAVQVYDHGMMQDGRPFIVMEFLTGEPLDTRLEREKRIAPIETARIIFQVCRALSRAHAAGIVHRDLKPENVFLVWDDEDQAIVAKVVDFGIAKFTNGPTGISSSTRTGSLLGTPYFMSPEQARGLRSVDFHTDLWSLGVIAYRCIVGKLPFDGVSVGDLLVKICTAPIPVPSQEYADCPAGFDAWFARALQREPAERFSSARELAEQLNALCGGARMTMPSGLLGGVGEQVDSLGPNALVGSVRAVTAPGERDLNTGEAFTRTTVGTVRKRTPLLLIAASAVVGLGVVGALLVRSPRAVGPLDGEPSFAASGRVVGAPTTSPLQHGLAAGAGAPNTILPVKSAESPSGAVSVIISEANPSAAPPHDAGPQRGLNRTGQSGAAGRGNRQSPPTGAPSPKGNRAEPATGQAPIELGY